MLAQSCQHSTLCNSPTIAPAEAGAATVDRAPMSPVPSIRDKSITETMSYSGVELWGGGGGQKNNVGKERDML